MTVYASETQPAQCPFYSREQVGHARSARTSTTSSYGSIHPSQSSGHSDEHSPLWCSISAASAWPSRLAEKAMEFIKKAVAAEPSREHTKVGSFSFSDWFSSRLIWEEGSR